MNKTGRTLLTLTIALAAALFAAALMVKFSPGSSRLAFVGWAVFFLSLQLPWLWVKPSARSSCTSRLARFRGAE